MASLAGIGALASGLGSLGGLFRGRGGPRINFGDFTKLREIFGPFIARQDPLLHRLFVQGQQQTYFTPEQYSQFFRQLTAPGVAGIGEQFGQARQQAIGDYASRGQLFGGSLTGTQAQLASGQGRALSDLFANVGGQLGVQDVQLGAQRQGQSQALMAQILDRIMQQYLGLGQLARRG